MQSKILTYLKTVYEAYLRGNKIFKEDELYRLTNEYLKSVEKLSEKQPMVALQNCRVTFNEIHVFKELKLTNEVTNIQKRIDSILKNGPRVKQEDIEVLEKLEVRYYQLHGIIEDIEMALAYLLDFSLKTFPDIDKDPNAFAMYKKYLPKDHWVLQSARAKNEPIILFCIDKEEIKKQLEKKKTPFEQIQFLKQNFSNIEKGIKYYSKHENHNSPIPPVWDGVLSARAGFDSDNSYSDTNDLEAYKTGVEQWCIYCEFQQIILDIQSGKYLEKEKLEAKTEQETPTFTNSFDNIKPTEIYEHFKAGLVEKGYLTVQELNEYLKAAFELKTIPETLFKIKDAPNKAAIEAVFYTYYKNVAGKIYGKQNQYAALLGDYFEGYKTTTVSSNFSKSVY